MKFCSKCGQQCNDDAAFCPFCGHCFTYESNQTQQSNAPSGADTYSVMSILGFIFSFIVTIAGLVISIIAYNDAKNINSRKSLGLAKAGIIISAV